MPGGVSQDPSQASRVAGESPRRITGVAGRSLSDRVGQVALGSDGSTEGMVFLDGVGLCCHLAHGGLFHAGRLLGCFLLGLWSASWGVLTRVL